jgi:hypothetical protein
MMSIDRVVGPLQAWWSSHRLLADVLAGLACSLLSISRGCKLNQPAPAVLTGFTFALFRGSIAIVLLLYKFDCL